MILDTTVCVDLLRERSRGIRGPAYQAVHALGNSRLYLSVYSVCELNTGALLSANKQAEQRRVADFVQHVTILYPDVAFPTVYAEAGAALLKAGTPIPVMDLLIGITAKTNGLPLLTRDKKHFHCIPGLAVEWYGAEVS